MFDKHSVFPLYNTLTLVRAMLLLMLAPVVGTAGAGPMGGCRGRQRRGHLYNSTNGHTQT
jgi:hypothetical protein